MAIIHRFLPQNACIKGFLRLDALNYNKPAGFLNAWRISTNLW
jgi:hypothetical protein